MQNVQGGAGMIKAELNYNPYLLETSIKFNGQGPRINSLVEKFQGGSLQKWVYRIPDIFYDEMNGYDFELEFSGTERDYQEVVNAFRRKGVTEEEVRLFHKNVLGNRYEKSRLITQLIKWLEENNNRNFDFNKFKIENMNLLYSSYIYIIFQGSQLNTASIVDKGISVEHVDSVEELRNTELKNTPILLYLSKENIESFQRNLKYFMLRDDVEYAQLFFLLNPSLETEKVERIIKDLGISEPNIVSDIFDEAVKKYIELYPVSEYLYSVILLLRNITNDLSEHLQAESEKCAIENREVHAHITQYEDTIRRLKQARRNFINRDNIEVPIEWINIENELMNTISNWRKRKTKIVDEQDAELIANEFESDVKGYYSQFGEKMVNAANAVKQNIDATFQNWYGNAEFDSSYQPKAEGYIIPEFSKEIIVADELKKLYEEEYVQPKEDILGMFFKTSSEPPKEPVLQKAYYYQSWRNYVIEVVEPKEKEAINGLFESIKTYEQKISELYINHLSELIEEQTQLKNREAAKLSDEERMLQNDIDWLVKVQDQLKVIARG